MSSLNRLKAIGFEECGEWTAENDCVVAKNLNRADSKNVLYAFVVDDEVMCVGKSVRSLKTRMYGYQNPHETQRTNYRNKATLLSAINSGSRVVIYVLPDNGLLRYGEFHLNMAAGLEDSLVNELKPPWNSNST